MQKVFAGLLLSVVLGIASPMPGALGAAEIVDFRAEAGEDVIHVLWETSQELGNLGFYLWRSEHPDTGYAKLPISADPNEQFIPSEDFGIGAFYEFVDAQVTPGVLYYYRVQDVPANGSLGDFAGPVSASVATSSSPPPTPDPTPQPEVACTLATTSTATIDSQWQNAGFDTNIQLSAYVTLSLISGTALLPGSVVTTTPDFFRLDNATIGARYRVQAIPDETSNYNLGIVVYNSDQQELGRDADVSTNGASLALWVRSYGPYYFKVYQTSSLCTGGTYSLDFDVLATPSKLYVPLMVKPPPPLDSRPLGR